MNQASQPSQQNTIIEEIKHRVLEVDSLRNGTKHAEDIELPLDYIAALDEITTIDREEIEEIARDVIAKHKNITRILPQKRQKTKQRDMNQWLINISLLLIVSVTVKVLFLDDDSPKDPNEKSFATRIVSTDFNALQQDASNVFSDVSRSAEALIPSKDAIPDLPFTFDDIQNSAVATFSSIVQSTQELIPNDAVSPTESTEVFAAPTLTVLQDIAIETPILVTTKVEVSKQPDTVVINNPVETAVMPPLSSDDVSNQVAQTTTTAVNASLQTEQQVSEIALTSSTIDAPKIAVEDSSSTTIPDTGLLTALKAAFFQLTNIKAQPSTNTGLANHSLNDMTSAELIPSLPVDIVATELIMATEVMNKADEEVIDRINVAKAFENIDVTDEDSHSMTEVISPAKAFESPTTEQIMAQAKPQDEEQPHIATVGNYQPISTAPIEPLINETPATYQPLVTANMQGLTANDKANTVFETTPRKTTIADKPISTEPEELAHALAIDSTEKISMVIEPNTALTTETANNDRPQSGSQVLRVALEPGDTIDVVTEKIIAAQQAPQISIQANDDVLPAPTENAITDSHYDGLNLKLQLNSIVDLSQLAKISISKFYTDQARLPKPADNIALPINELKAHPLISDIFLSEHSDVIVKLAKYYGQEAQLTFTPNITSDGQFIHWKCNANINPALLTGPGESPCPLSKSAALPAVNSKL